MNIVGDKGEGYTRIVFSKQSTGDGLAAIISRVEEFGDLIHIVHEPLDCNRATIEKYLLIVKLIPQGVI